MQNIVSVFLSFMFQVADKMQIDLRITIALTLCRKGWLANRNAIVPTCLKVFKGLKGLKDGDKSVSLSAWKPINLKTAPAIET